MKRLIDGQLKKYKELEDKYAEQMRICEEQHDIKKSQESIPTMKSKKMSRKPTERADSPIDVESVRSLPRAEIQRKLTKRMSQFNENHDQIKELIKENQKLKIEMDLLRRISKEKAKAENIEDTNDEILEENDSDIDNYIKQTERPKVPMEDKQV